MSTYKTGKKDLLFTYVYCGYNEDIKNYKI